MSLFFISLFVSATAAALAVHLVTGSFIGAFATGISVAGALVAILTLFNAFEKPIER